MASSVSGTKVMWELKPCKRKHVGKEQWEHFLSHGPARGGGVADCSLWRPPSSPAAIRGAPWRPTLASGRPPPASGQPVRGHCGHSIDDTPTLSALVGGDWSPEGLYIWGLDYTLLRFMSVKEPPVCVSQAPTCGYCLSPRYALKPRSALSPCNPTSRALASNNKNAS